LKKGNLLSLFFLLGEDILELTPFDRAIAGEVMRSQRSYQISNIYEDPLPG
jgi:hypothetical protein